MGVRTNSSVLFSLLILLFTFNLPIISHGSDTISANQSLSGDQTLVSANGTFKLGFYDQPDGFNSTQPIWQSFDFPTDTWLPGGKIAYNKRTKTHQNLTSWKNSEDPSRGLFSLSLKADTEEFVLSWNETIQYRTSGSSIGQISSLVPVMRLNYLFSNFSYVDNENESYFTYSMMYDPKILLRFVMGVSGQIMQLTWSEDSETTGQWDLLLSEPREQCESVGDWNLSDYSGGCARTTKLQCGNTSVANQESTDKFYEYPNVGWLDSDYIGPAYSLPSSVAECASSCLNDCNCIAYSYDKYRCSIWIGELVNLQLSPNDGSGITLYLRLAASEFSKGKENKGIIIGAVAGSVA
ncbi:hypothetical protein C3L33_11950, partial [Rhododendron williamsianum]